MPEYTYNGPLDCTTPIDTSGLQGKTAIVTGGASGIGLAYVQALVKAGASVVVGDLNADAGYAVERSLTNVKFVQCDVTEWDSQVHLFEEAEKFSPSGKIHHVVANAGMINKDEVYHNEGWLHRSFKYAANKPDPIPSRPNLKTLNVNIFGSMYTIKLALHYFVKQNGKEPSAEQEDTSLILIGSGASYFDGPRGPQYAATKWAMRGVLHSLRRTAYLHGSRVNMISPWYIKTQILSEEAFNHVASLGVVLATIEEAQQALLRLVSDTTINGKSIFVGGKKWSQQGYWDLDLDDFRGDALLEDIQTDQMISAPVSKGLFID